MPKSQLAVIDDLQNNPDYIILNNPLSALKFVRKLGKKEQILTEVYMPKLFYELVSQLKPEYLEGVSKLENIMLTISIKDFLKSVEASNSKNLYSHVIDCVDRLQTTQLKWAENGVEKGATIISFYEHHPKSGEIEVQIHSELAKKVLELTYNNHFSFLKNYLYKLNNAQAIKLFPYFMSWRNKGMVEMTLEAFKKRFSCEGSGYNRFSNLKMYVLDPAITEINDKTDLRVSYKLLGVNLTGIRPRITGLQFFITEKAKQQQLPQAVAAPVEVVETTIEVPKPMVEKAENLYLADILRVFQVFEPNRTTENIIDFLGVFDNQKAVLEACLYAEQEQAKGRVINNFRGYLVAGIPKGLGSGILEQRAKDQVKAQQVEQKKTAQADKAAELDKLLKDADILRGGYKKDINGVIKHTTDADKENVANILRAKSSIYAGKTLADFKGKMFISTYVATFIAAYPERFADVQRTYQGKFNGLTAKIKKLDPTHNTDLFYY